MNQLGVDTEHVHFTLLRLKKGMGNASRAGIEANTGRWVLLIADDLTFGFDDFDAVKQLDPQPPIVSGSSAPPASVVSRALACRLFTWGFSILRFAIVSSRVGDTEGTVVANGAWARKVSTGRLYLGQEGWQVGDSRGAIFLALIFGLVIGAHVIAVVRAIRGVNSSPRRVVVSAAIIAFGLVFVVVGAIASQVTPRVINKDFIPDVNLKAWAELAERAIDPGSQMLVNPQSTGMRLAFGQGGGGRLH